MIDDDIVEKVRDPKPKLAAGAITEEEFWDEVRYMERPRQTGMGMDASEVGWSLGRGAFGVFLHLLPFMIGGVVLYFVFIFYPAPSDIDVRRGKGVLQK